MIFTWDEKNREHIATHGVTIAEAQFVTENAKSPFPQEVGDGKRTCLGTAAGRLLQVIYVLKGQDEVAFESVDALDWAARIARVIHAAGDKP